jgi:hypothetical protein
MTAILNIFRRNWGLKLLALALALVIYYSMRDTNGKAGVSQSIFDMKGTADGGTGK